MQGAVPLINLNNPQEWSTRRLSNGRRSEMDQILLYQVVDNAMSRQTARISDRQQATSRKQQAAMIRSKIRPRPSWPENADVAQYVLL
ncbi:hypothetical protein L596_020439 [Steinernema carpocapsae]|uniref:Uncharacterized protein n=1 Tax=Steinernema carpocapsae TaxID=34508 RepID=A0A4U5MTR7_STECR|nr:hypothetical protein L596_020439 [Steinernema carpocapsae]